MRSLEGNWRGLTRSLVAEELGSRLPAPGFRLPLPLSVPGSFCFLLFVSVLYSAQSVVRKLYRSQAVSKAVPKTESPEARSRKPVPKCLENEGGSSEIHSVVTFL